MCVSNESRRTRQIYRNRTRSYGINVPRQQKIESRQDYENEIVNNPIQLLKVIKEHALNYQDKKYPMLIIMDTFRKFATTRQKEGEALQEFTKQFKVAKYALESHLGGRIML